MRLLLGAMLLFVSSSAMAQSSARFGYGYGGWFTRFDRIVSRHNQTGELFRIEGHCQSACTLFLAIKNVCIEPGATLLFHAGHNGNRKISASATDYLLSAYNEGLRSYLVSNHHMDSLVFHKISGSDMIQKFGYRPCPAK
jgi:hypothetical protein